MKEKFIKFMNGRYGFDDLNRFLSWLVFFLIIINFFIEKSFLISIAIILLFFMYFRILSKDIQKRYLENQKFLEITGPFRKKLNLTNRKFKDRKTYKYIKCPRCAKTMRVPKGKGKVLVTCPNCKNKMEVRT